MLPTWRWVIDVLRGFSKRDSTNVLITVNTRRIEWCWVFCPEPATVSSRSTVRFLILAAASLLASHAVAAVFRVNSTGDAADADPGVAACDTGATVGSFPECTLRAAIEQANNLPDPDQIEFSIPGPGPHRIQPLAALPDIVQPVVIDGYTQLGAASNTLSVGNDAVLMIELDASSISNGSSQKGPLTIGTPGSADGSRVSGLVLNGLPNFGMTTVSAVAVRTSR